MGSRLLLEPLTIRDVVTPELTVDRRKLLELAVQRTEREYNAWVAMGRTRQWHRILLEEIGAVSSEADDIIEVRKQCAKVAGLPPKARLLAELHLRLHRQEHGLAYPYSAEDVAHTRQLIAECERTPDDDPGIELACMIEARR